MARESASKPVMGYLFVLIGLVFLLQDLGYIPPLSGIRWSTIAFLLVGAFIVWRR